MTEWIQTEASEECRTCSLAVLIGEYQNVLSKAGEEDKSKRISQALLLPEDPILRVAEEMDKIKEEVTEGIKAELQGLDCLAQSSAKKEK